MNVSAFTIVRAAHFLAVLVPPGVLAFEWLVSRPALALDDCQGCFITSSRCQHRLALASAVLALASGLLWFGMVAADMSGEPPGWQIVSRVLAHTGFGTVWAIHLALIILLLVPLSTLVFRRRLKGAFAGSYVLSVAVLVSLAFAGHAGATPRAIIGVPVDVLHLLAASLWPASLVSMAYYLWKLRQTPECHAGLSEMTRRFSRMSVIAVPVLAFSGIANAGLIVGGWPSFTTSYGLLLIGKALGLACMAGIGAVNLLVQKPRLQYPSSESTATFSALLRNIFIESLLACFVLVLTGILGQMPPA